MSPVREVALTFLRLGLTSFGGPVAHLAQFRRDLVEQRRWLSDEAYASLVALAHVLPGPTSSQVGALLGWHRAGAWGALAAWLAFTLPAATLLAVAAAIAAHHGPGPWLHGLMAAVVAVVAVAIVGMARALCPDVPRAAIALAVGTIAIASSHPLAPMLALAGAGAVGLRLPHTLPACTAPHGHVPSRSAALLLLATVAMLAVVALLLGHAPLAVLIHTCLMAGGMVMGGGHVVLPLLHGPLVLGGLMDHTTFLAGYALAQAMPGPLFTVAAWLGMVVAGPLGAVLAVLAMFAPGVLLALGCLRWHQIILHAPRVGGALRGINAGVVGLLGAAWLTTIVPEGLTSPLTIAIAISATALLLHGRIPVAAIIITAALMTSAAAAISP